MTLSTDRKKITGLTIDGSDSRDLDDAFWLETMDEEDSTLLHISIADVGEQVALNSEMDRKAQEGCTTHYLAHTNRPMLPRQYADDLLSLLADVERNTLTFSIPIRHDGEIGQPTIQLTRLTSQAKLSYQSAEAIMRQVQHPLYPVLNKAHELAQTLFAQRRNNGALTLYDLKKGYATSEDGMIQAITADESYNSHIVIQEFMILVNQVAARFFAEHEIPGLYRNHTSKAVAPEREILLKDIDNVMTMGSIERLETLANKFTLIFNKAHYSPVIEGHYALNLPAYMHITSPIRRYADLVNIRQLRAFIAQHPLPYSMTDLQAMGEHINTVLLHHQQDTRRFFKRQMHKKNNALLREADDFSAIEGNDFYLLLKTAASRKQLPDSLQTKITDYLTEEQLDIRILFVILFKTQPSTDWTQLKERVLQRLGQQLHHATTLLTIAAQTLRWGAVQYEREMIGNQPPHSFATTAQVSIEEDMFISDSQTTLQIRNKKTSEQLANFSLLCKIVGIEIDVTLLVAPYQQQNHEHSPQAVSSVPSINYIGKLVELCQSKGWQHAEYQYGCEGPSHQPTFEVQARITISDKIYESEIIQGGNKKSIKQLASANLIEQIKHLPSNHQKEGKNFIGMLNTLFQQQNKELPVYTFSQAEADNTGPFKCVCTIMPLDDGTDSVRETFAYGASKKRAKQVAAERMWRVLQD